MINKIKKYRSQLAGIYGESEAKYIVITIIKHYSGQNTTDILLGKPIDEQSGKAIVAALEKAVEEYPVQYILGETEFYGHKFFLNENVLIPRCETEELVDIIIKDNKNKIVNILDIGTGSGCIAIALSCELPQANVFAIDISVNALNVAINNNNYNKAKVLFAEYDILSNNKFPFDIEFDIIVSNPPYVRNSEKEQMRKNVLNHEPHLALFVENTTPLVFYEACISFSKKYLKKSGTLYAEINENLGKETELLFKENGFDTELIKDMSGKDRIIKGKS